MFKIGDFEISNSSPCFIIAELSANHNGDIDLAIETIRAAKRAGANAVKLQTYTADTITLDSDKDDFRISSGTIWDGRYLHELYQEAHTPWEWHKRLFDTAKAEGLVTFSSPFDHTAVDFLETLNVPAYKIASFEITDIALIEYVASKDKPIIISTGISEYADIQLAIEACKRAGNENISLLKCTSSYPAPVEEANMIMIQKMAADFNVITGLSDHTLGNTVPMVAVSLGAKIIEKHIILDKSVGGPDASFSLDESEFKDMVDAVRKAESAIGVVSYDLTEKQKSGSNFKRSLYISQDIKEGDIATIENIRSVRPGYSLHPKHLKDILGKKAQKNFTIGDRISLTDFV